MNKHISSHFEAELESVRTNVLKMGGQVEEMIHAALQGLATGDQSQFDEVFRIEKLVNAAEVEIDDVCNHVIARRQPTASDLRLVVACMKMTRDLERAGDEAEKMARMAMHFYEASPASFPRIDFSPMSSRVTSMLRRALDAFAREDESILADVIKEDKLVDEYFRNHIRLLISYVLEDARTISRSIDMLFFAKAMERIGDHSKNMAEHVYFMIRGRDIRHADTPETPGSSA
jgi:phosphate transport system protein